MKDSYFKMRGISRHVLSDVGLRYHRAVFALAAIKEDTKTDVIRAKPTTCNSKASTENGHDTM